MAMTRSKTGKNWFCRVKWGKYDVVMAFATKAERAEFLNDSVHFGDMDKSVITRAEVIKRYGAGYGIDLMTVYSEGRSIDLLNDWDVFLECKKRLLKKGVQHDEKGTT